MAGRSNTSTNLGNAPSVINKALLIESAPSNAEIINLFLRPQAQDYSLITL